MAYAGLAFMATILPGPAPMSWDSRCKPPCPTCILIFNVLVSSEWGRKKGGRDGLAFHNISKWENPFFKKLTKTLQ